MRRSVIPVLLLTTVGLGGARPAFAADLPPGFVDLATVAPTIAVDLRYAGSHNFIGEPIDGYARPRAVLTHPAALALRRVQEELAPFGLGLLIYDAYRPQRAVDHFVRWAHNEEDLRMKAEFYPKVEKARLFELGYIAEKSGHSRGSTVDLTLVSLADGKPLDLGSPWDFFDPVSWPSDATIAAAARAHRLLLRTLLVEHGFRPYDKEWWHFTLEDEPFPETTFDFPLE